MHYFSKIIHSKSLLWFLLAVPAIPFVWDFIQPTIYVSEMLYQTGVISTQLLVLTLCITPMVYLLKNYVWGKKFNRWLLLRRRNFGVASFIYASIHLLIYIRENFDMDILLSEAISWEYGSGWIAFVVMLPLALSSNDISMKLLGKSWKRLQQFAYLVAIVTFFHWISFGGFVIYALPWLAILVFFRMLYFGSKLPKLLQKNDFGSRE